ncbi:hypothetical protein VRK_40440 [Vibrio sp. MEBiC08052]|nr:hypothetical protein VRK_40440 [Vibrio sp. MEBiC08052]
MSHAAGVSLSLSLVNDTLVQGYYTQNFYTYNSEWGLYV